jgi:polyphosphate:AMP phosphotransferase
MFEAAELGQKVKKADYEAEIPGLRSRLLAAQRALRGTGRQIIVIVSGVEGAGKSEVVNRLHEWLDARGISTQAFWQSSDEEEERPRYWRFWRALPPRGTIGILFGSWYTKPIVDRVYRAISRADLDREVQRIAFFEEMLAQDGAVIVKFWFHLPQKVQHERVSAQSKEKWYFGPQAREFAKRYDRFARVSEAVLRATDTAAAPWHVVEATDKHHRDLTVARTVLAVLENVTSEEPTVAPTALPASAPSPTILSRIDMSETVSGEDYERKLSRYQARLSRLSWKAWNDKRSTVILFEGWDAAGKGGAIRRLIAPIDARLYRTISIATPTEEERAQHYLWRFWRQLPRAGMMTIYDRSWYGRVLVERVEGFASSAAWSRAYREINEFEEQLVESGIILLKFWLHIDREEQLRRFRERQEIAWKQHKITDEDWRNREKWDAYEEAVHDMVSRTSSAFAPWNTIAANDKKFARLETVRIVTKALESALE